MSATALLPRGADRPPSIGLSFAAVERFAESCQALGRQHAVNVLLDVGVNHQATSIRGMRALYRRERQHVGRLALAALDRADVRDRSTRATARRIAIESFERHLAATLDRLRNSPPTDWPAILNPEGNS